MKIIVDRSDLVRALGHVHRVVERRNTIPIFNNILLRSQSELLEVTATDLEIEITDRIPHKSLEPGTITLPAVTLFDISRKLAEGGEITIVANSDTSRVTLTSGNSHFELPTLPANDFPSIEVGEFANSFQITGKSLGQLIEKTHFAISTEETRHYLNGIYLHITSDQCLRAVATDGHRLAQSEIAVPKDCGDMAGIIIPRKAIGEIRRLILEGAEEFTLEISQNKIRLTTNNLSMISRLIDGTFPDYHQAMPKNNDKLLCLEREEFKEALERVSTVSSDRGRAVKLEIAASKVRLSVSNPDIGSANEQISAKFNAKDMTIGFNIRYLFDILAHLETAKIAILLAENDTAALIHDHKDHQALYLVMPMFV